MINLTQRLAAKNAATGLNIISLFDGMSCGMLAAVAAGINVATYLASEIEKAPMAVSNANWRDSITQIGNVLGVMDIITKPDFPLQDLLVGGSPCQDFSMAGKRKGAATSQGFEVTTLERYLELKADGVEFEGQSYLFWEYVRVLRELQKQNLDIYFLLENVKMAQKWEDVISQALGVSPVLINSARVSAQNRVRLYWTNISFDRDIKDRGIMLADILDLELPSDNLGIAIREKSCTVRASGRASEFGENHDWDSPYLKTDKELKTKTNQNKASCLTGGAHSGGNHSDMDILIYQYPRGNNKGGILDTAGKAPTVTSSKWQDNCKVAIGAREVGRKLDENGKRADDRADIATIQRHELRENEKSNCLTTVGKDSLVAISKGDVEHGENYFFWKNSKGKSHQQDRAYYKTTQKSGTVPACKRGDKMSIVSDETATQYIIRRFTVAECEKLQTVPVGYCASVVKTHAYKMIGNGWTIEVIAIILCGILNPSTKPHHQPRKPFIQQDLFTVQPMEATA